MTIKNAARDAILGALHADRGSRGSDHPIMALAARNGEQLLAQPLTPVRRADARPCPTYDMLEAHYQLGEARLPVFAVVDGVEVNLAHKSLLTRMEFFRPSQLKAGGPPMPMTYHQWVKWQTSRDPLVEDKAGAKRVRPSVEAQMKLDAVAARKARRRERPNGSISVPKQRES